MAATLIPNTIVAKPRVEIISSSCLRASPAGGNGVLVGMAVGVGVVPPVAGDASACGVCVAVGATGVLVATCSVEVAGGVVVDARVRQSSFQPICIKDRAVS